MCTISVPYRSECQIPFCEKLRPVVPHSTENNDVWWNSLSRLIHDYISKILRMGAHSNDPQVQFRPDAKNSQNSLEGSSRSMPFYGNSQPRCVPSRNAPRYEVAVCPPPGVNTNSRLHQNFASMVEVPARMPISPPFHGVRFNSESSQTSRLDGQGFQPRFPPRRDPLAKQSGMSSLFQEGCNSSALMRHLTDKDDYSVDGDETLTNQDQTLTNQGETLTNQPNEALLVPRGGTASNGQAEAAERHPTLDQPKAHEDILHAFINDNAGNTGMVLPSLSDIAEEIPPAAEVPAVGAEARDSRLIGVVTQVPALCINDVLALSKHWCHLSEMLMNGAGAQDFQGEEGLLVDEKFCPVNGHYTHSEHWSMYGTIGRGKFGSCKLASDLTTEFICAVKEVELRTFIHNSQEVTIWCMPESSKHSQTLRYPQKWNQDILLHGIHPRM
ncbi:uncharacterized protein [Ptychodera flava]|uniref:uncharacterized protein n=1 Tax=Ptychodera flava TaxID=63121 RepID=UPI003969F83B